jgi:molybdopterin/thiamine biosynthesis adenylyltransferase
MGDERHSRQIRFAPIGPAGQQRLGRSTVAVVGCGALGASVAEQLCRAGVGRLRLIDRDFVEPSNLQRQSLYTEEDAARSAPKAVAAAEHLRAIDHRVEVEPVVADLDARTVADLIAGCDLVVDGTDTFDTRHVINDACYRARTAWIHGACVGSYGLSVAFTPGAGPCLRCLQDQLPAAGETPTCESAGVITPIVHIVAAWQVAEALKLLVGHPPRRELWSMDVWENRLQRVDIGSWRDADCPTCGTRPSFPALAAPSVPAVVLCGRDALQLRLPVAADIAGLAQALGSAVTVANEYLVRWRDGALTGTCFRDGRVVVHGTSDLAIARSFCARHLG